MMRYRKKPVVIEAVQITDATFDSPHPNPEHFPGLIYNPVLRHVRIPTLEGEMIGQLGDWIITGVKGERYPCKPDIFAATYEPVPSDQTVPVPAIPDWQQRVIEEKQQLDERLARLNSFIGDWPGTRKFNDLAEAERKRLIDQRALMTNYSDILGERIAAFSTVWPEGHPESARSEKAMPAPPVDNAHVAPGCERFTEPKPGEPNPGTQG